MSRARCGGFEASAPHGASGRGEGRRDTERGQGTVEYGLLVAAAALFVVVGLLFVAGGLEGLYDRAGREADRPGGVSQPPDAPVQNSSCDPSYQGVCVPPAPPDLDCPDLVDRGITVPVTVVGDDPHDLDPDGDGLGC